MLRTRRNGHGSPSSNDPIGQHPERRREKKKQRREQAKLKKVSSPIKDVVREGRGAGRTQQQTQRASLNPRR